MRYTFITSKTERASAFPSGFDWVKLFLFFWERERLNLLRLALKLEWSLDLKLNSDKSRMHACVDHRNISFVTLHFWIIFLWEITSSEIHPRWPKWENPTGSVWLSKGKAWKVEHLAPPGTRFDSPSKYKKYGCFVVVPTWSSLFLLMSWPACNLPFRS